MNLIKREQLMRLEGYRKGEPPWAPEAAEIDREVTEAATCDQCGHEGMDYVPYYRRADRSYRSLCVCPDCGHVEEF